MFLLETQQPLNQPTNEPISIHFYPTRVKATKRDKEEKKSQPGSIEANLRAKTSTSINSVFGRKQTNKPFFRAVCLQIYKCSRPITIKPILLPPSFQNSKTSHGKMDRPNSREAKLPISRTANLRIAPLFLSLSRERQVETG